MSSNSRFFFVLVPLGAAIGLGSIWLYPYYSYIYGGLFLIPYTIALFILGFPLLMLEFSAGQYFNKNIVDLFASIKKWFSGIGWLMVFNAFIVMSFYAVVLSWHVIYFFVSFGMQWKKDASTYFFNNVLQVSHGFRNFTQFSLPGFIALILAWVLLFFCIRNGFDSLKKWFLAITAVFAFLMLLFLMYSLTLENALSGIYAFLKPDLKSLVKLDVWVAAFSLAAVSLGLSFGIMHAAAKKFGKGFISGASFIVLVFEILTGIAVGFILFGILGFLSARQGIGFGNLVFSDFGSSFTILASALPYFYKPTLLSLLFFLFLSIFFVLGTASLACSICTILADKLKTKQRNAAVIAAGFGFLFGLLFIIKPGYYIMDIASHFAYYNILTAILLEALAVGWFFDAQKIADFINQHSVLKIGALWKFAVKYTTPLILLLLLFFQLKSDFLVNYGNYPWLAVLIFGVGIVAAPVIAAFLMPQRVFDRQ
ncbi:hypothetical protein HYX03_02525 [Candidatus Woesearchaeota archaeon]|nr:hypothetical protein [Candidatus Woesearchaeota archaeon]